VSDEEFLRKYKQRTLAEHVALTDHKLLSYLPIATIENVLGLTVKEYQRLAMDAGNKCLLFRDGETCIQSGAVYTYRCDELSSLLMQHRDLLFRLKWPQTAEDFVKRIASHWYSEDDAIMPVVRAAFGDA
jgi:hypothetical protein